LEIAEATADFKKSISLLVTGCGGHVEIWEEWARDLSFASIENSNTANFKEPETLPRTTTSHHPTCCNQQTELGRPTCKLAPLNNQSDEGD